MCEYSKCKIFTKFWGCAVTICAFTSFTLLLEFWCVFVLIVSKQAHFDAKLSAFLSQQYGLPKKLTNPLFLALSLSCSFSPSLPPSLPLFFTLPQSHLLTAAAFFCRIKMCFHACAELCWLRQWLQPLALNRAIEEAPAKADTTSALLLSRRQRYLSRLSRSRDIKKISLWISLWAFQLWFNGFDL